jgi:hypothetical protein
VAQPGSRPVEISIDHAVRGATVREASTTSDTRQPSCRSPDQADKAVLPFSTADMVWEIAA